MAHQLSKSVAVVRDQPIPTGVKFLGKLDKMCIFFHQT